MNKIVTIAKLTFLLSPFSLLANTYYLSNSGNDAAAGTSPTQPWQTIARLNKTTLHPGDRVLLAGGQTFSGSISLQQPSQGTATQPIVIRSYGVGQATIASGEETGFYAYNTAGIELRHLTFVGSGRLSNKASGIVFYLDSANTQLQHVRLDSLDVSGYQKSGAVIGSWNDVSGYTDVRITNCQLHANGEAGLTSYAFYPLDTPAHHNWYVGNCVAYDNAGRADITDIHTGNGIMLSGIDGVLIEKCTAYHNGWLSAWPWGGPVGIWGWSCNNLVIQYCESHHNQSGTSKDGGGFDLDGGCTNSVLQYNYSHDNQGPGYLLAQFDGAPAMHDLTVRYNISENDARDYDQGAIQVWSSGANGGIVNAAIHNNTVYLQQPANGSSPKALYLMSDGIAGITVRNNIFETSTGLPVVSTNTTTGMRLEGNCYWAPNAALVLNWAGNWFSTLADWRAATGQETLAGGARATGICTDPAFTTVASATATPLNVTSPTYTLAATSPLLGTGLDLRTEFGLNPGPFDFFGAPTPRAGTKGNIGAVESRPTPLSVANTAATNSWCQLYPTVVQGQLHVLIEPSAGQIYSLQLFDLLGRPCRSWQLTSSQLQTMQTLSLTGLPAGRYIVQVQGGSRVARQSLLVAAE